MHRSGIEVSNELKKAFNEATGIIRISIENESFAVTGVEPSTGGVDTDFEKIASGLEDKIPQYACLQRNNKWVLVCFVPENAPVRQKMLYASSRGALKEGLGSSQFSEDFFISHTSECTMAEFERHIDREVTDDHLTHDELMKRDAHNDSMRSQTDSVKMVAIADIPIKVNESTEGIINEYKSGSISRVLCSLDRDTEVLTCVGEEKNDLEAISAALPKKDAAYVLFRYTDNFDADHSVFLYYCPDVAHPKTKMFYSSCKSMVIRVFEEMGVVIDRRVEISDPEELAGDALHDELNPKTHVKTTVAKPSRPGRKGGKRLAKFSAN